MTQMAHVACELVGGCTKPFYKNQVASDELVLTWRMGVKCEVSGEVSARRQNDAQSMGPKGFAYVVNHLVCSISYTCPDPRHRVFLKEHNAYALGKIICRKPI